MTAATSRYPMIGQAATTAAAMRAAATLIESTGIAGLSVTCDDAQVCIQVGEYLGDLAARAGLVARLAAAIGATAVHADSAVSPVSWVRADGAIGGLRVQAFTPVPVQHASELPLACNDVGQVAEAATSSLPPDGVGSPALTRLRERRCRDGRRHGTDPGRPGRHRQDRLPHPARSNASAGTRPATRPTG